MSSGDKGHYFRTDSDLPSVLIHRPHGFVGESVEQMGHLSGTKTEAAVL